jgi:hypothetical protein
VPASRSSTRSTAVRTSARTTGWLLLSGDGVHFQDNWTHKRVPSMNVNRAQTLASLKRIETLLEERKAQLRINHDKPQTATLKHAPNYYE